MTEYNKIPDIDSYNVMNNPTLTSPNTYMELPFLQTKESLLDMETYKKFLDNAISKFRHSRTYKSYKGYLLNLGLDRCQFHSNITSEMATVEMHHAMITIFDIAVIITEHVLNTVGYITTFDLVKLLKDEHKANNIPVVMLSLTAHQLEHADQDFYIHLDMITGNWFRLLEKYNRGITQDIAFKILFYVKRSIDNDSSLDNDKLVMRDKILNWSGLNGQYYIGNV
jgi:hypothetical protein